MNAYAMFRHSADDSAFFSMSSSQVEEFYNKIVKLRGTCKRTHNCGNHYLGMRISGSGEEWSIFRELISYTKEEGSERTVYFVDENREVESWLFEIFKPHLNRIDVDTITSDLDEVLHYSGGCFGENYLG